jgi:hypothetical protein
MNLLLETPQPNATGGELFVLRRGMVDPTNCRMDLCRNAFVQVFPRLKTPKHDDGIRWNLIQIRKRTCGPPLLVDVLALR